MALPLLVGRAIGGSIVKAGGRALTAKALGRDREKKKKTQPGRIIPGRERVDGGKGGAIIKPKVKMVSAKEIKSLQTGDTVSPGKDPLKSIYSNVILIEKILKGTLAAEKDQLNQKKKDDKKGDREKQEQKLETKTKDPEKKTLKMPKVPGMGIFGFIKNFIGNVILGYFAVRLLKYLPQLMQVAKVMMRVVEFVADVGVKLIDGLATFIDWGYKAYDATRGFLKNIGGDTLAGAFDGIMKAVDTAITVLAFALGAKSLGGFGGGKGGGGRTGISGRGAGRTRTTSPQAARRYAQRFGRDAATKRFGEQGVKSLGGKYARSGATNFARKATVGVLGKGGTKAALKIVKPLVKRIPVIGGVLEFALSLLAGEPVGKAAFRAVGSGLGTWIGGALGSLIPVPFVGTAIGAFIGGAGGSELAGAMYDAFFGGKTKVPDSEDKKAYNQGGKVSRGFSKETIKQQRKSKRKKPSVEKIEMPEGGQIKTGEKTEKAWWDFLGWAGTGGKDEVIDLDVGGQLLAKRVVDVGNKFGEDLYFGPMLSLVSKFILGQKPTERDYKNIGYGINLLVGDGVDKGKIAEGIKGYAEGGKVQAAMSGIDVSRWVTDTFRRDMADAINKNYNTSATSTTQPGSTSGPGTAAGERDSATGTLTPGTQTGTAPGATTSRFGTAEQKKMLDAIAFAEGTTGSYGTLYGGRVIDELAAGEMTIAEVLKMQKSKMYKGESVYGSGYDSNATGRYQFMSYVLEEEIGKQGVDPSEKFTPEMQDRLILNRISRMRGVTAELLAAEGMSDKVIDMLAPEFASFPNLFGPDAQGRVGTNTSYYGQGGKSKEEIKKAYGDSTGESSAIELADTQAQPPSLPDEPGDTSGGGDIKVSGSGIVNIGKDLISKGFSVAEHPDFTKTPTASGGTYTPGKGSVSRVHKGRGHYEGRAIDVTDWRGSLEDSKGRYRSVLTSLQDNPAIKMLIHDSWGGMYAPGQKQGPGRHGHPEHMHIEVKDKGGFIGKGLFANLGGTEFVTDADSTAALKQVAPGLQMALNQARDAKGVESALQQYASYEQGAQQTVVVEDPPQQQQPPQSSDGGMMMPMSGGSGYDGSFEFLDAQG